MTRTPSVIRELLEKSGYAWDPECDGWVKPGGKPGLFEGRLLDGGIAAMLTPEQIREWIKNGENQ